MRKLIAIVAGEPNSINSEIIVKAWRKVKKNLFVIGNHTILQQQINKIGLKIKISKINSIKEIKHKKNLCVLNVPLKFKSAFESNFANTKKYVLKSLETAHNLALNNKIKGFINAPINKNIFEKKNPFIKEILLWLRVILLLNEHLVS